MKVLFSDNLSINVDKCFLLKFYMHSKNYLTILTSMFTYIFPLIFKLFVSRHSNWSRHTPSRLSAISSAAYAVSLSVSVHCIRKVHENLFASAIFSTQGGCRYKNQQLPTAAADRLRSQSSSSSSSLYLAHGTAPPHLPPPAQWAHLATAWHKNKFSY